jgi:formate hydrogenlyase subunit 6/NADH:ubiquinone oxidoreductase subunit I
MTESSGAHVPASHGGRGDRPLFTAACTGCGCCIRICPLDAIALALQPFDVRRKRNLGILEATDDCDGCGLCFEVCPRDAIEWSSRSRVP